MQPSHGDGSDQTQVISGGVRIDVNECGMGDILRKREDVKQPARQKERKAKLEGEGGALDSHRRNVFETEKNDFRARWKNMVDTEKRKGKQNTKISKI